MTFINLDLLFLSFGVFLRVDRISEIDWSGGPDDMGFVDVKSKRWVGFLCLSLLWGVSDWSEVDLDVAGSSCTAGI